MVVITPQNINICHINNSHQFINNSPHLRWNPTDSHIVYVCDIDHVRRIAFPFVTSFHSIALLWYYLSTFFANEGWCDWCQVWLSMTAMLIPYQYYAMIALFYIN